MEVLVALIASCAFSYACAGLLKKAPMVFYIVFALAAASFASGVVGTFAPALNMVLVPYLRRAPLAFGLFTVVMFVGVLPEGSSVRKRLAPVRGTISLLGFILVVAHVAGYATTYWASLTGGVASTWIVCGFVLGVVVSALLLVLSVTSVTAVRKAMDATVWSRIQKLAYAFYLLMYVHLAAMLVPSSLAGGNSLANLVVYTIVVIAYAVLRIAKARRDKTG